MKNKLRIGVTALALMVALGACAPAPTPPPTPIPVAPVDLKTVSGTLETKLGDVTSGDYTIAGSEDIQLNYIEEYAKGTYLGYSFVYTREIQLLIARPAEYNDLNDNKTFVYVGNRPFLQNTRVRIQYRPVLEGQVITNNDLVSQLYLEENVPPPELDFPIEGLFGPYSVTGVIVFEGGMEGIEYVVPEVGE